MFINFYPKVRGMFTEYDEIKARNVVLGDRVRILRDFELDSRSITDVTAIALPIANPGTLILSHIKSLTETYGIEIKDVSFNIILSSVL